MTMTAAIFPPDRRSMEFQWRYLQKREWRQKAEGFCACGALEQNIWPPMCAGARARRRVVSAYHNSIAPFHPFIGVVVVLYRCIYVILWRFSDGVFRSIRCKLCSMGNLHWRLERL